MHKSLYGGPGSELIGGHRGRWVGDDWGGTRYVGLANPDSTPLRSGPPVGLGIASGVLAVRGRVVQPAAAARAQPGSAPDGGGGMPSATVRVLPGSARYDVFGIRVGFVLRLPMAAALSGEDAEEDERSGPGASTPRRAPTSVARPLLRGVPDPGGVVTAVSTLPFFHYSACEVVGVPLHLSRHVGASLSGVSDNIRPIRRVGVVEMLAASSRYPLARPRRRALSPLPSAFPLDSARKPSSSRTLSVRGTAAQQKDPAQGDNDDPH